MTTTEDAKIRAATTYNSAADKFDDPANSFWDVFGRKTVEQLHLEQGARVLDVCCGGGASAIPAADKVGPAGSVLGIDLAENLLTLARRKSENEGLQNIHFRLGDMLNLGQQESSFDAVVCVFGIFFVADMPAAVSELWRLVRPGGKLAITTWGPRFFEPASTAFWNSIREVRPDLYKSFNPWDRITDPDSLRSILTEAGVNSTAGLNVVEISMEIGTHPVHSPEDWWSMVLGSGYRGTIEQLNAEAREQVRQENLSFVRQESVTSVESNVLYAIATRTTRES